MDPLDVSMKKQNHDNFIGVCEACRLTWPVESAAFWQYFGNKSALISHKCTSVLKYIENCVYRGCKRERPRWSEAPSSNPQRSDQQPDRQVEVLLHLQNLPPPSRIPLQHLWQLCRWEHCSEHPITFGISDGNFRIQEGNLERFTRKQKCELYLVRANLPW